MQEGFQNTSVVHRGHLLLRFNEAWQMGTTLWAKIHLVSYERIFPENDEDQKEEKQKAINEAKEAYEKAREALGPLSLTHPIRLAVFLNLSVFQCEILNDRSEAILTARNAFEDAVKDLAQLPNGQRDDAETIL